MRRCVLLFRVEGLLEKEQRKKEIRGKYTKTQIAVQALGRRMTTATPIRHDMWLISMEALLMLYGSRAEVVSWRFIRFTSQGFSYELERCSSDAKSFRES